MGASGNQNYLNVADMFNGGGAGASGTEFKGGILSGLLNDLGVKPMGYKDRMDAMQHTRPQLRPQAPQPQMQYGGRGNVGMPSQPMQYGGRGTVGMPSQPMQGSGMTPANAYQPATTMTVGTPTPVNQGISPAQLRSQMMTMFPGLDESQLQQRTYEYLRQFGGM